MSDVYSELVSAFNKCTNANARIFANEFIEVLNDSLLINNKKLNIPVHWPPLLQSVAAKIPVQPASLPLPWQACNSSLLSQSQVEWELQPALEAILATVPSDYRMKQNPIIEFIAPYEGSLVAFLAIDRFISFRML